MRETRVLAGVPDGFVGLRRAQRPELHAARWRRACRSRRAASPFRSTPTRNWPSAKARCA